MVKILMVSSPMKSVDEIPNWSRTMMRDVVTLDGKVQFKPANIEQFQVIREKDGYKVVALVSLELIGLVQVQAKAKAEEVDG